MSSNAEKQLAAQGIELPNPSVPPALYSPVHATNGLVTISGQPPFWNGTITHYGKVGRDLSLEEGQKSARVSALNVLAHLKAACGGDLDRVTGCVRMLVLVNCSDTFNDVHRVADGASGLMHHVFPSLALPTRSSLGCITLPMNIATEVEASFTIR